MVDLIQDGEGKFERDGRHFIRKHFKASSNIGISSYEELGADNNIQSVSYKIDLTSISATEMLDQTSKEFGHVGFTRTDLEETFKTACSEGILKPAIVFRDEVRYEIADPHLEDFIFDYNFFSLQILRKMLLMWSTFREPNPQEIRWLDSLRGRRGADAIRSFASEGRDSLTKFERTEKVWYANKVKEWDMRIYGFLEIMRKKHLETMEKYRSPTQRM